MPGEYTPAPYRVPLYWELLDNRSGNSSTQDHKAIITKCIRLLGKERIGLLLADREFVGHQWLKYLKDNGILFCGRLPKHHLPERFDGRVAARRAGFALKRLLRGWWVGAGVFETATVWRFTLLFGSMEARHLGSIYRRRSA